MNKKKPFCIKIVSSLPYRTRIRVIGISRKDTRAFQQLVENWSTCESIIDIKTNQKTRSILFIHDDAEARILEYAEKHELLKNLIIEAPPKRPYPGQRPAVTRLRHRLHRRFEQLDNKIQNYTAGELDLPTLAGVALLSMSFYQTFSGHRFLPAGESLLSSGLKMLVGGTAEQWEPEEED